MTGDDVGKLILLVLAGAALVNVSRGTFRTWLRAKFIGSPA